MKKSLGIFIFLYCSLSWAKEPISAKCYHEAQGYVLRVIHNNTMSSFAFFDNEFGSKSCEAESIQINGATSSVIACACGSSDKTGKVINLECEEYHPDKTNLKPRRSEQYSGNKAGWDACEADKAAAKAEFALQSRNQNEPGQNNSRVENTADNKQLKGKPRSAGGHSTGSVKVNAVK